MTDVGSFYDLDLHGYICDPLWEYSIVNGNDLVLINATIILYNKSTVIRTTKLSRTHSVSFLLNKAIQHQNKECDA